MRNVLFAVALTGLFAGCSDSGPPDEFEERAELPSCGTVTVVHTEPAGPEVDCFVEAVREGKPAEVVVRMSTTEGDPVVTYYRTSPDAPGIELWTDATQDAFGSGEWDHSRCEGTGVNDLRECGDA